MQVACRTNFVRRALGTNFLLFSAILSGCASIDGQAPAVLTASHATEVTASYSPKVALETYYHAGTDRRAYRDKVVGLYMAAADIRYLEFRRNLSRETKGTNLVLDIAVLGLTGGASLSGESTANALSAAAAGLVGSRASISKELWFEKTLPALISAMDSRRTEIRTQILTRMQGSAEAYSLSEAFSDIARYQEAASLNSAVDVVTAAAAQKVVEADKRYADVVLTYTGAPPAGSRERKADIKARLEGALATPGKINDVADALGIARGASDQDTLLAILRQMNNATTLRELDDISDAVTTKLGDN